MSLNEKYRRHCDKAPGLFSELMSSPAVSLEGNAFPASPAIYVFLFNGEPVHVGRTRNLRQRLKGHVTNSHYSASFAFKRARSDTGMKASYKKGEGRGALLENPIFAAAFAKALAEVRGMTVRHLVVNDPIDQYLLELYAALELDTSLTEFDTH
ncbi:MAG: hypothetical protein WDN45_11990 [Caulobacteraceae bacterium]